MLRKIWVGSSSMILLAGVILTIGTVGASDLDLIDFKSMIIRFVIALLLFGIGFLGLVVSDIKRSY